MYSYAQYNEGRQMPINPYGIYGYGTMVPPTFPTPPPQPSSVPMAPMQPMQPSGTMIPGLPPTTRQNLPEVPGMLPIEQSYIENILRLNKGKTGTFYFTYEHNSQWNAKVYRGVIEAAGRDHLILSDPKTGMRYLLLMVNFDYATFDEPLNYQYPFAGGAVPGQELTTR